MDDSEAVPGMVFAQKASTSAGGPTRVENAKIALVQFCISPPKTDLENNVIISDYAQMDRRVPQASLRLPPLQLSMSIATGSGQGLKATDGRLAFPCACVSALDCGLRVRVSEAEPLRLGAGC